jgi:CheY-like chemotaxis protein
MKKKLILVAEDDLDDRFFLEAAFTEVGDEGVLAFVENGVEVLDFLEKKLRQQAALPDMIILDLNMPKKNGKETLIELKKNPLFDKIPVIIYTTTRNDVEVTMCYELGASTYIVKPSDYGHIREVVASIKNYLSDPASMSL